jgi:hypothetical protein
MYKKTNRILAVALMLGLGISLMPLAAFGAFDDVTLTTDTVISVNGVSLNVSGSSAVVESITVNATNFSFVLLSGSSISVTSSDGTKLSTNANVRYIVADSCNGATYVQKHSSSDTTVTVTVTPESTSCTTTTASDSNLGSSHSGGGGGGGGYTAPVPTVTVPAPATTAGQSAFTRLLSFGSAGDDVRNLQTRLLGEGLFSGEATGYFGPLTQAAVKAYQAKYGIDQLGIVGPATRAQLNKVVTANTGSNAAATSQLTPTQISAIMSQINALLQQVQILQAKLKALSN